MTDRMIEMASEGSQNSINNADIPILYDVMYIERDLRKIDERRAWQGEIMLSIKSQKLSGMPGGGHLPGGLEKAFAVLADLEEEEARLCNAYTARLRKAYAIIDGIESQSMRTFVTMKYIEHAYDREVREVMQLSRRGFERAKRCVEDASCMAAVKWQERYIVEAT